MKKTLLTVLAMITLGLSFSTAQSTTLLASNEINHAVYDNVDNMDLSNIDASDANTPKTYDIPESAAKLELNAAKGLLNIDVNNTVKYTKAELLSSESNTTVQSLQISENNKSVDISNVKAGTYYMILSNEEGDVFSEKIIIL